MKIISCLLYTLLTILYCRYADGSMLFYGIGQMTILAFICILSVFAISNRSNTVDEKLFLQYTCFITTCRLIYTYFCIPVTDNKIVNYYTDVFILIVSVTFLLLLFHTAYKKYKYSVIK